MKTTLKTIEVLNDVTVDANESTFAPESWSADLDTFENADLSEKRELLSELVDAFARRLHYELDKADDNELEANCRAFIEGARISIAMITTPLETTETAPELELVTD